ncbi:hypothetical protein Tco_0593606 [Tanacetum coccineum]
MMVQANQEEGKDTDVPIDLQQTPITTQPSTSKPQKKQFRRKRKKNTEVPHPSDSTADVPNEEHVPTHSNDPLLSGKDIMKLTKLMDMCTKLSERVLDLEHTKTAQAQEITNLKLGVNKLEKKAGFRTHNFKRLYKRSRIEAIDRDAEVTLVETQMRNDENDDNLMFDTGVYDGDEIAVETEEPVINAATTTKSIPSPVAHDLGSTRCFGVASMKEKSYHGFINTAAIGIDVWFLVKRRISRHQHVLIDKETAVEILVLLDLKGRISTAGYEVNVVAYDYYCCLCKLVLLGDINTAKYGYIKNHMKIVKNKQARTRERKSEQKPEAKPGESSLSQIQSNYGQ